MIGLVLQFSPHFAVARATTPDAEIDKQRSLARIDSLSTEYQALAAMVEIDAVLPDARAQADSSFLLDLLVRKGGLSSSFGQIHASVPVLNEAIALAEALSDSLSLCEGLRWLTVSVGALGRGD